MKTIIPISTMYQILSWNLKTLLYQLLFLERPDPLLFLVKMTRFLLHLHILFDATKLKFHPPKTGSISRASWTFTPTMIPRVGPGGVSSKSLMSLDIYLLACNTQPTQKIRFLCHPSFPFCISCAYFLFIITSKPIDPHINNFSCTIFVPLLTLHCTTSSSITTSFTHPLGIPLYLLFFQSSLFSEHENLANSTQSYTTLNYYFNLIDKKKISFPMRQYYQLIYSQCPRFS